MSEEGLQRIDRDFLRDNPLPAVSDGGKEERGTVAVVGGSREVPGAVLLAGLGALRAGAGKLQVATVASRAAALGLALPEALVMELPETAKGGIHRTSFKTIEKRFGRADALLVGPGTVEEPDGRHLAARIIRKVEAPVLVIDAGALPDLYACRKLLRARGGRVVITPHAGEMAALLGWTREKVEAEPRAAAERVAEELRVVVVMKGARTLVAEPGTGLRLYEGGSVGLGTSGSGDVLAGIIAGLVARGAEPARAACCGVFLHGEAGARLEQRVGPLGFLAREILDEVPRILTTLGGGSTTLKPDFRRFSKGLGRFAS